MTPDLLLELGCEDLPARFVVPLAQALARGVTEGLARRGVVATGDARTFATPRRIAVLVEGVSTLQPDQAIERLGPAVAAALKDGRPTPAALGFAKSCGVAFESLGQKDGKLHFVKSSPGRATADLMPEILEETLKQMDELVPKRMRWGAGEETFVRPVQWILCLLGDAIVPLKRFGLESGRVTFGHRFHAPAAIALASPSDYANALEAAHVWADVATRKAEILRQVEAKAGALGGHARITMDLLDEVTALVEWPVAIAGQFEDRFLELPPEVIVATVETNQRYFTVFRDPALTLLSNHFITLSNIDSRDVAQVIAGNERVVRPRLTDALFFWQQDLKHPLADDVEKLRGVMFQKDLGSVFDKAVRMTAIAAKIEDALGAATPATTRAAHLAKADLVTRMVYEFPELQGLMGGYYATQSGESPETARAIREHYRPTQQGTPIPSTREGRIVALADKLDTLAGIFAIGQKPTASKDPFALRRAALGLLRILVEGELPLDLRTLVQAALHLQPSGKRDATTADELVDFIQERLRALVIGESVEGRPIAVETFEAVKALKIEQPVDFRRRLVAVHRFVALPEAPNLAAANKRIRNLLRQAGAVTGGVDASRFEHEAERALLAAMSAVDGRNAATTDYTTKLVNLAALRGPVDAYFDGVMVNADDAGVRANRLALLQRLEAMCREVADLSCLPG